MTSRHRLSPGAPLRVERTPDTLASHTHAGRIALPLIVRDAAGAPTDALLVMTAEDTEQLADELRSLVHPRAEGRAS